MQATLLVVEVLYTGRSGEGRVGLYVYFSVWIQYKHLHVDVYNGTFC